MPVQVKAVPYQVGKFSYNTYIKHTWDPKPKSHKKLLGLSDISPPCFEFDPRGIQYFIHVSITTPIVSALKNYYILLNNS
jgi:hypothetical protein